MDAMSVKEASERWGISERRVQKLCEEDRIPGVVRFGRSWAMPKDAEKPFDGRFKSERKKS
ncbi:helix-turn-helix domain-containing protein [Paenibacillus mendelii]|uniref:Helix-turn-helix domain-containing protein n=1 Tax=Paenibacillus mendelii TaxID=206163 RepID=A0ABV6JBM2_9BACL|nr:helix-turn-helix domain-containing protein [Paenibacillus mendelii]MCQ6563868.1 helix-turn-helix domain-containing protein [Paenibacillus mendelii]